MKLLYRRFGAKEVIFVQAAIKLYQLTATDMGK